MAGLSSLIHARASSRGRFGIAFISMALIAVTLHAPPAYPRSPGCTEEQKPEVFPADELAPGITGTGWTVIEGRDPVPFDVEILGVLPGGIAPGIDFVLIQTSGPTIEETGGIAFGMSGSPVYIDGRLAGAVAYGFFAADQTVGGMTPAEPMVRLFDAPQSIATAVELAEATEVDLTPSLRTVAARAEGVTTNQFPATARHLPVPLAVSGLNQRAMDELQEMIEDLDLPVVPYRAGAAATSTEAVGDPLEPGQAVAGAISTGDLTFAGVGTTTARCGDLSVHFGHPFFWEGRTSMGMNAADVLKVVKDPSNIFGPFKIATVAEGVGTIEQDRLVGIRGVDGVLPQAVPVTSDVSNPDLGTSREGQTDILKQEFEGFPLLPFIAAFHLLLNQDVIYDRIGGGTATVRMDIRGIGPSGAPFRLVRRNMHLSRWDASSAGIWEFYRYLWILSTNRFGDVEFTDIRADSSITEERLTASIRRVQSASSLQPRLRDRSRLRVRPGDLVRLRVFLLPRGQTTVERVNLAMMVPRGAPPRQLVVRGGSGFRARLLGAGSFNQLLRQLRTAERNNDLVAEMRGFGFRTRRFQQDHVIQGQRVIRLVLRRR